MPRPTPVCPLLDMRVSKRFFEEASEQWFRSTVVECRERYVFNSICDASPIVRKCLTRFSCIWDSCYFVSDNIAEHCSAFAPLRRCKGIRTLYIEVRERTFEEFNRLACVDAFTDEDFKTMQEARDLLTLPLLGTIELKASRCSLGVTDEEKAKWLENVAALDAYMKSELKKENHAREQQRVRRQIKEKNREKAKQLEGRKAHMQKIHSRPHAVGSTTVDASKPTSLLARARTLFALRTRDTSRAKSGKQDRYSRNHPALRPSTNKSNTRSVDWKASQDKIIKRAMAKREKKQPFPFMDRIDDLENAYAGVRELFEERALPQQELEGLAAFCKKYPAVVISLATTTSLSIVNSIALWNVLSQR